MKAETVGFVSFAGHGISAWRLEIRPPIPILLRRWSWRSTRYFANRIDAVAFARRHGVREVVMR